MNIDELTQKLQKKELQMLKELSKILKQNQIPFFLAYGSALGCARHSGFIPWDDDIDIFIKGTDYAKLKEVFRTQNTGNLILHDYDTVNAYPFIFPKIVASDTLLIEKSLKHTNYKGGIYIDVFPLAEVSNNKFAQKAMKIRRYIYYSMIRGYYYNFDSIPRKLFSGIVRKVIDPLKIQAKIFKEYTQRVRDCKFYSGSIDSGELYKKQYFEEMIDMPFEDTVMPMAAEYKDMLEVYYGDYMIFPKEEDRVSNHNFEIIKFYDEI